MAVVRTTFEHELQGLRDQIMEMGRSVNQALYQAVEALRQRQHVLAQHVINNDQNINRERYNIEERALTLIATQGPVAQDLRFVAAVIHIASELERMADHAKGIARINEMMGDEPLVKPLEDIPLMSEWCRQKLEATMNAFLKLDAEAARQIAGLDDELDTMYNRVYLDLLKIMTADGSTTTRATYLLWVAHNLERYGDRIVNICERIIFVATGELVDFNESRNG